MTATTDISGLDVLRAVSEGVVEMPPAAVLLGWKALDLQPGRARVQYTARPDFCNPHGAIQGGFLAAMLDDAMGPALFTTLPADQFAPTIEMKVNFVRPARPGPIIAEGTLVHKTSSIAFLEGKLTTIDGDLIATATATARIFDPGASANGHSR
ncbi:MAG: PaaI family thioesterase [Chloroflexi bacterium]|nr:MAG: PaaI family thioesterase [Chloroflexota bacterium]